MATEYWIVSESAEVVLNAGMYYSNLWMDCLADSTGVSDCRYFPSMMNLSGKSVETETLCLGLGVNGLLQVCY